MLCLAGGDLAASAREVGETLACPGEDAVAGGGEALYDLVVASRADEATLRRARAALADGGVLYAECARARRIGADRLLRRLAAAGFGEVEIVAPWPALRAPQAWLPVRTTAAARYFLLEHPVLARHWLRRGWLAVRRTVALVGLIVRRPAALVVVARAGRARGSAVPPDPRRLLPWWVARTAPNEGHGPGSTDWLLLTPGATAEARVLGMLIGADGRRPLAVVKLARTAASRARMARGALALERLEAAGVTGRGSAPMLLGRQYDAEGQLVATTEQAIPGRWLDVGLRGRSLARVTDAVTDWLTALALATRGPPRPGTWERAFRLTVERFVSACGHLVDAALLDAVVARLTAVGPLPTVFEHHDFRPWNLYATPDRRLVAFDWDNARPDGLPALDLLQCHAFLAFSLDGTMRSHRFGEAQRRAESGPLGRVRRAGLARYAAAVGVEGDALRAVRAFAWMGLAADQAEERAAAGRPLRRVDVSTTFLSLWEFEARRSLE